MSDIETVLRCYRRFAKAERLENLRWKRIVRELPTETGLHTDTRYGYFLTEHPLIFAWDSARQLRRQLYRVYQIALGRKPEELDDNTE